MVPVAPQIPKIHADAPTPDPDRPCSDPDRRCSRSRSARRRSRSARRRSGSERLIQIRRLPIQIGADPDQAPPYPDNGPIQIGNRLSGSAADPDRRPADLDRCAAPPDGRCMKVRPLRLVPSPGPGPLFKMHITSCTPLPGTPWPPHTTPYSTRQPLPYRAATAPTARPTWAAAARRRGTGQGKGTDRRGITFMQR